MKRFMFLSVLFLIVGFFAAGCKGDKKAGETSAEKKIESKEEKESLYLTEKDVKAFIKAFPVFVEITKKAEKEIGPLTDKKDLLSGMKFTGELKEYKEEVDAALKDYGFTLESFAATYAKVMGAFFYGQMGGASIEDESEEAKAFKANWEIVKKYKSEIENLFKEE